MQQYYVLAQVLDINVFEFKYVHVDGWVTMPMDGELVRKINTRAL